MPRSTPSPPAPIRLENDPTPSSKRSRNTNSESTSTIPCPTWSSVIDVIGPMARGVRASRVMPSANSRTTRRSSSPIGVSGTWWGSNGLRILVAIIEATSHSTPARAIAGAPFPPARSTIHPPTNTPRSRATVPPTVAIEFAISRSSVGTRRGTTATAVAR